MCTVHNLSRIGAGGIALMLLCSSTVRSQEGNGAVAFSSSNLPIVIIDTHGQSIPDEPKITADMGVIYNGPGVRNNLTDSLNAYNGKIGIEIRGSSSQMFPKKQYAVETRDTAGNSVDVTLLGFPAENDWILSAPYNDKSLMRDPLMYKIANSIGRYASRSAYCELVLNNEYMGVYILLEKVKRGKNRVNIAKITVADTTGDALTGGYMVKIDKVEGASTAGWNSQFLPFQGAWQRIYYQYHYPDPEDITPGQVTYLQYVIRVFEATMASNGYADTALGYPRYIDVNSFVDYLLLNEFSKNVDAYRLSAFMYKDKESKGGKLTMGPIWDFNHGFGNSDYYDASLIPGFELTYLTTNVSFRQNDSFQPPFWWTRLVADPNFSKKLAERWNVLRKNQFSPGTIHGYIDSLTAWLDEAKTRNFEKWPVLGVYVWPNYYVGQTYQDEIAYLKQWITDRVSWMDQQFGTTSVVSDTRPTGGFSLSQNYPNPFNPSTVISYEVPAPGRVVLRVYDVLGREVATLVDGMQQPGRHAVTWNAAGCASGVYFYRLEAGQGLSTKRALLVR